MSDCPCPDERTPKEGSPGPVEDDEAIVCLLFDPENFSDGQLQAGAISVKRLKKAEFSVSRPRHTALEKVQAAVVEPRTKNPELAFVGAATAICGEIRDLKHTSKGERIFCVVDDPLIEDDYPGHAIIRFSDPTKGGYWSKNDAAAALGDLLNLFSKAGAPLAIEACFQAEAA